MNADIFAEWLRRQGYRVVRTESSYWYEASPHVYQAFPYHWTIAPSEDELRNLLHGHRAVALRYSAPITASRGKVSYHVVCQGPYDLKCLPRQSRQNVVKGLQYATVEPISLARLAEEGWRMRVDTLQRQGRTDAESEGWWRRMCLSAQDLPGFEAWGALHDGELVASCLTFTSEDCFTVPHEQSASAHLPNRVNNAIFYSVTQQALERPGIASVFYCLESLDAPPTVDEFKFRMGYVARPVRQRVVFHPWLAPLANPASRAALRKVLSRYGHSATLAKADGMLRFYLEGQRSLAEQEWPESLVDCRQDLLVSL